MIQLVKCLPFKYGDPSLNLRTYIKSWVWQYTPVIPLQGWDWKQEDPWDWGLSSLAKLVNSMFPKRHYLKNKVEAWKDGSVVNSACYFSEGEPEFRSQHSCQLTTAYNYNSGSLHWHCGIHF